jgi:hypothetical protein
MQTMSESRCIIDPPMGFVNGPREVSRHCHFGHGLQGFTTQMEMGLHH